MGLEHQVELLDIRKAAGAAAGAGDALLADISDHLVVAHGLDIDIDAVLARPILDELVGTVAALTALAVDKRVIEVDDVARSLPHAGVHQNAGVEPDIGGALLHELFPPGRLDILLHQRAEGAVVPRIGEAAVDIAAGEDKAAVFTQGNDLVHGLFGILHSCTSFLGDFRLLFTSSLYTCRRHIANAILSAGRWRSRSRASAPECRWRR